AVKWTVDNGEVVNIQYEGKTCLIKPVGQGTAIVTAKVGDKTATCTVTVSKPAATITLSSTNIYLINGGEDTEVTATLANADDGTTVEWSLANGGDAIVTITPDGNTVKISPIGVGKTTLTAKLGDVTKTAQIEVQKAPVTLTLDKEKVELVKGAEGDEGVKLTETVIATAENNEEAVDWKIGSTNVATIVITDGGSTCTVTAVNVGTTKLTASVEGVTKTIDVVVDGEEGDITIELSEAEDVELKLGAEKKISANVVGTLKTPVWSVDDDEVIEIIGEGNEITVKALKEGNAVLTVTVGEGEAAKTETLNITVVDPVSLSLDVEELSLKVGAGNGEINVTAEGAEGDYTYDVEGDSITVAKNGNVLTVTPVKKGTATIKVSYGGKTVECEVDVQTVPEVEFDSTSTAGEAGGFIWHNALLTSNVITDECTIEVAVKVNGSVVTPNEVKHFYNGTVNDIQVQIAGSKYDAVEIEYTFKNADGEIIATSYLNYAGAKEIKLDRDEISIKKDEKGTVSVTEINGSSNIAGKAIAWEITEGADVATIVADGASVEITAVKAGTATLTCTVGDGEDAIVKTCAITVYE
ncbi:MAG: Ig-like domain-containing protein, partial [Clostridiales bacterium]|nr:Ig-like domain-containing protein [Clostridiales bacterium]